MKKFLTVFLSLILIVSAISFIGCKNQTTNNNTTDSNLTDIEKILKYVEENGDTNTNVWPGHSVLMQKDDSRGTLSIYDSNGELHFYYDGGDYGVRISFQVDSIENNSILFKVSLDEGQAYFEANPKKMVMSNNDYDFYGFLPSRVESYFNDSLVKSLIDNCFFFMVRLGNDLLKPIKYSMDDFGFINYL